MYAVKGDVGSSACYMLVSLEEWGRLCETPPKNPWAFATLNSNSRYIHVHTYIHTCMYLNSFESY